MIARPAVAIRRATDADLPACADLHDRVDRAVFVWDPKAAYGLDAFKRSIAGEEMTLAWAGSSIVGLISVYRSENFVPQSLCRPELAGRRHRPAAAP